MCLLIIPVKIGFEMMSTIEKPVKITILPYKPPRKAERTWPMIKGSVFSMGAKANSLNQIGLMVRKHG